MLVRFERHPLLRPLFGAVPDFEDDVDEIFGGILTSPFRLVDREPVALDVTENENESVVVAEMPGIRKEDIKVTLHDGELTVSGNRKPVVLPEQSSWIRNEIATGQFSRTIAISHPVKDGAVSAEYTNGILRVVLPKADEARPRQISIR